MPKKQSLTFFEVTPKQKQYLKAKLSKYFNLNFFALEIQNVDINEYKDTDILGVFVGSKVDKSVINKLKNLKLIVTMSTGFDHIDTKYANKKNIAVCNVPTYGQNTVAEHAFALILAISRKILPSVSSIKQGEFKNDGLTGFDLRGKTIGVVGCGSIGKNLIKMAYGFGMNIVGFDLYPDEFLSDTFGVKYLKIEDVFKQSDIISLHLPFNEHTKHIINKDSISTMKNGVVIVNTARGGLIETDALYDALVEGKVLAAGLDVFEEEGVLKEEAELLYSDKDINANLKTVITNHRLINHPRVIATPHNAFNSKEAKKRILDTTIKNIVSFRLGKVVNSV